MSWEGAEAAEPDLWLGKFVAPDGDFQAAADESHILVDRAQSQWPPHRHGAAERRLLPLQRGPGERFLQRRYAIHPEP